MILVSCGSALFYEAQLHRQLFHMLISVPLGYSQEWNDRIKWQIYFLYSNYHVGLWSWEFFHAFFGHLFLLHLLMQVCSQPLPVSSFIVLSCLNSLYFLDINPLLVAQWKVFPLTVSCLFPLQNRSSKDLIFFVYFAFITCDLMSYLKSFSIC